VTPLQSHLPVYSLTHSGHTRRYAVQGGFTWLSSGSRKRFSKRHSSTRNERTSYYTFAVRTISRTNSLKSKWATLTSPLPFGRFLILVQIATLNTYCFHSTLFARPTSAASLNWTSQAETWHCSGLTEQSFINSIRFLASSSRGFSPLWEALFSSQCIGATNTCRD